ncbi:DNA (cytosine-5-)-methyltransferase [Erwinia sp. CPCC 100877]|nr:DNA (cytosine-5-)-methyltransferase [Erwinia sp. CPCC 100877]
MEVCWPALKKLFTPFKIMTLKVFEAFAGVGSQRMALRDLGIDHEVVAISEIDKFAIQSYEAIHGPVNNLGDISKVEVAEIPEHDLFTYSFPCQDISVAGKQGGLDEDSETRSSLLWQCKKVIQSKKPKYLLLENVKNLVGKKHKANFDKWLAWLADQGYTNYWQVLNAKHYGVPQNRERVFVVSILGDHVSFEFPQPTELTKRLKDVLEDEVEDKYYLSDEIQNRFKFSANFTNDIKVVGSTNPSKKIQQRCVVYSDNGISGALTATDYKQPKTILIKNNTEIGYLEATDGDCIDLGYPDSKTRRGRVQPQMSHTLTTASNLGVLELPAIAASRGALSGYRIRKLTPRECWRLMGFDDADFYKAQSVCSNSQLYKQAGNSIVKDVLMAIFEQLLKKAGES